MIVEPPNNVAPGKTYEGKARKPVKDWSYSALSLFEECPAKYYYLKVLKYPDPPGPSLLKGRKFHTACEDFLTKPGTPLPKGTEKFGRLMHELRALNPLVELKLTFRSNWTLGQTGWFGNDVWLRAAWDAAKVYDHIPHADLIDHKTGKRYDSNDDQLRLFALTGFLKYPRLQTITTRLWYHDSGLEVHETHSRDSVPAYLSEWNDRAGALLNAKSFLPRPETKRCGRCNAAGSNGGPCRFG